MEKEKELMSHMLHGGDIYTYQGALDFSVNINPLGPAEEVVSAAKSAVDEMERYPDPGCRALRAKLSKKLQVPEDFLIFGNGAAELMFTLTLAERPRKAVIAAPAFAEYERALLAADCEVQYYYRREETGFILEEDFLDMLRNDVDMVFLCSPDNPVGNAIESRMLRRILGCCEEKNILLVLDECFIDFMEGGREATLLEETKRTGNLLLLRAFTKIHALPGLRLGFGICGDKELLARMSAATQPWNISIPAQAAGLAALRGEERIKKTREYVAKERTWLQERLQELGITYFPSQVNYLLFKSEQNLFGELLKKNILIRDCQNYEGLEKGFYRIAVRKRKENEELVEALRQISPVR